jgi:hypothetical protein
MEMINEHADNDGNMLKVAEDLLDVFQASRQEFVLLVGDGKTYQHLLNIKQRYGESLKKLLIFPGDWHTLKNYQETLMKIYYHAGLKEIAQASGFHGATLTSLEKCSNFKHTHNFLLQVWEAIHRVMLLMYIEHSNRKTVVEDVTDMITTAVNDHISPLSFMSIVNQFLVEKNLEVTFFDFIKRNSEFDKTWKFWSGFVFDTCYVYVSIYLSLRGCNWNLRNASLKSMMPVFAAFDRTLYQRLIPTHIADLHIFPQNILNSLEAGAFVVNLTGTQWKSVALDEAHEVCVNKDLKAAITYPTESYLQ